MFVGACGYTGARVDHVGLSFRAGPSPCVAGYVDPPVTDPDGRRVAVAGSAFVRIRCRHGTDIDFESIGVPPEARLRLGADRFRVPAAENVVEVVRTGYRRSVLTLVVGLRHVAPMTGGMIQAGGKRHLEFVFGHQACRRGTSAGVVAGRAACEAGLQPTQERSASTSDAGRGTAGEFGTGDHGRVRHVANVSGARPRPRRRVRQFERSVMPGRTDRVPQAAAGDLGV